MKHNPDDRSDNVERLKKVECAEDVMANADNEQAQRELEEQMDERR